LIQILGTGQKYISLPTTGLTSGCGRIATAAFFNLVLPAKLAYNEANRARPQSAEPQALTVLSFNGRGIRAYKRAGFKEIGRWREAHRFGGRAYDVIYMDCLATEFQSPLLHRLLPKAYEL